MRQNLQQKKGLVKKVFDSVFDKYDLMNDIMSLGVHRIWKKEFVQMMNPSSKQNLIDVGCGTGDIAKLFSDFTKNKSSILCVDPNKKMIDAGKKRLKIYSNIKWKINSAEKLNVQSNTYDFYSISFGLRNTKNLDKSISEAYRVLKKGGRFMCLEFSKIENSNLDFLYQKYSETIPKIGKMVIGHEEPYKYLIKSIENFANQNQLVEIMKKNKFINCKFRNLNGGIVSIHSGWKV